jgi:cyclase
MIARTLAIAACAALPITASAHGVPPRPDIVPLDALMQGPFDPSNPVTAQTIAPGLYVLFGVGGNILVSSGDDGVLMVDDQFPVMMDKIDAALAEQGDTAVDFVINTHWHFDHADGNQVLGERDNLWIVSQSNSREMMQRDNIVNLVSAAVAQPAYPASALPDITYDSTMQLFLNGQRIDLLHAGPAHTTGDTAVILSPANVVHLGDVFNMAGYPFIDADNGGSLEGVIAFCEAVLEAIPEDAVVIPGHGPVSDRAALEDYTGMLVTVRERLLEHIRAGRSFDDIMAAGVTAEWDASRGDPTMFINRSYVSLTTRYID